MARMLLILVTALLMLTAAQAIISNEVASWQQEIFGE